MDIDGYALRMYRDPLASIRWQSISVIETYKKYIKGFALFFLFSHFSEVTS